MNLKEVVAHIKERYVQEEVLLNQFDYQQNQFYAKPNPKYLFRGEQIFPSTKSAYHRLKENAPQFLNEITTYSLDLATHLMFSIFPNIRNSDNNYQPVIDLIGAYLQHYGFPIMYLDFTQNVNVAAFFATFNNTLGQGRICVIETSTLVDNGECILKLSDNNANRPRLQEAFALRMYDDKPDLKNSNHFKTHWIEFTINESDIKEFSNPKLLSTKNDIISDLIISYLITHSSTNRNLMVWLEKLLNDLLVKKNWA
jgi:hypothetical protein